MEEGHKFKIIEVTVADWLHQCKYDVNELNECFASIKPKQDEITLIPVHTDGNHFVLLFYLVLIQGGFNVSLLNSTLQN